VMDIPLRMRQTRTRSTQRESPTGFKCQMLSTSIKAMPDKSYSRPSSNLDSSSEEVRRPSRS
jgi:hypothetical protein